MGGGPARTRGENVSEHSETLRDAPQCNAKRQGHANPLARQILGARCEDVTGRTYGDRSPTTQERRRGIISLMRWRTGMRFANVAFQASASFAESGILLESHRLRDTDTLVETRDATSVNEGCATVQMMGCAYTRLRGTPDMRQLATRPEEAVSPSHGRIQTTYREIGRPTRAAADQQRLDAALLKHSDALPEVGRREDAATAVVVNVRPLHSNGVRNVYRLVTLVSPQRHRQQYKAYPAGKKRGCGDHVPWAHAGAGR